MSEHRWVRRWPSLLLVLVLATPLLATSAAGGTWVLVLPASGSYEVGQQIVVEVLIQDVVELYGADVKLAFDAHRLRVVDANPALPGVQITPRSDLLSPDLIARNEADNAAGTIWYAVTQLNPSEPVSGTGALFAVTFQTLVGGSAKVDITDQILSDRNAEVIQASTAGASYDLWGFWRCFLPLVASAP